MAAGLEEMNRDGSQDCGKKGESEQFRWEEWAWESMVEEDGSAREAFEPRGSRELKWQKDGQDEGGKEEQEEGGNGEFRRQDDDHDEDDEKHVGQGKVVRSQLEEDKQPDGEGSGWSNEVRKSDGQEEIKMREEVRWE